MKFKVLLILLLYFWSLPQLKAAPKDLKTCPKCECGIRPMERIIKGTDADMNEFPWIALMTFKKRFYCGGTLINDLYILSAAHCTKGYPFKHIQIHLGRYSREKKEKEVIRNVVKVFRHKNYNSGTYDSDIALLRMNRSVILTSTVLPICMPKPGINYNGKNATVIGWGVTVQSGRAANVLQKVTVPIIARKSCQKTNYGNRISRNMFCAGERKGGKDSCQGDSGGPLQVQIGLVHRIVGIVSWGWGCGQKNQPGVYTNVTVFQKWINSHIKDACRCNND